MSSQRQVGRNFLALGSGEAVARLLAFGTTVYLARVLGAQAYGVIALAAAVTLYLAKLADFGIEAVGSQEVALAQQPLPRLVSAVLSVRLLFTVLLVGLGIALAQTLLPPAQRLVFSLYALTLLPIAASTKWVHMGAERAQPIGVTRVFGELLALTLVMASVRGVTQIWLVPVAQLCGDGLAVASLWWLLWRAGTRVGFAWDLPVALPVFKRALPLMAQVTLGLVLYNSDVIFLRVLRDSASVGYYASAYTLVSFLVNLGLAHGTSLLPALTKLAAEPADERELYQGALARTVALALPIVVGGYCVAAGIIELAFGRAYAPATVALQALLWSVLPSTGRAVCWAALVARGKQTLLLRANAYAVVVNLALNAALIRAFGMLGAAAATIATESFVLAFTMRYCAQQGLGYLSIVRCARPLCAAAAMAVVVSALPGLALPLRVALGALAYAAGMLLLRAVRWQRGRMPSLEV